jgi:NhaP-type Na+/H+ or K+/H+ antiporter
LADNVIVSITAIIVLGIGSQWLAWRLKLPSILLLLILGFVVGPITGFINPDAVLGDMLFPIVSLAVALILFEGGLSLNIREIKDIRHVVRNMVTIGVLVAWILSTAAAFYILDYEFPIALLFGAILVVTGPTVIMPLLRHIRATGRISAVARWEGIVNDPIGAILAVLVFEAILVSGVQESSITVVISVLETIGVTAVFGVLVALGLVQMMKRYWIPEFLHSSVMLMAVIGAFTISNIFQKESGLFTVTIMGIIMGNQRAISVKHIIEFKENLGVILLSGLFIILAARIEIDQLTNLELSSGLFLLVLILVIRPASVLLSTIGSGLNWREKTFLIGMAPRGIVAAAVTAIFALELSRKTGYASASLMVPEMFLIIVGTVTIYGLGALPLARWLKLAQPNPQGVLIAGAHSWSRAIARALRENGFKVLLVDTNRENLNKARLEGCQTLYASILSEFIIDEPEVNGMGRLLALTSNDEVNSLASLHFAEVFGRREVYLLPPKKASDKKKEAISQPLRGRLLFDEELTFSEFDNRYSAGAEIKVSRLTEQYNYNAFLQQYSGRAIPLIKINTDQTLSIFTIDAKNNPQTGDTIISLIAAE